MTQKGGEESGAFVYQKTGIESLDELFDVGARAGDEEERGGICFDPESGFLGVIFGSAGSGKSILGLQLCCQFLQDKGRHAVYLTSESFEAVEEKALNHFGFISGKSIDIIKEWEAVAAWGRSRKSRSGLSVIQMPLDKSLQQEKLKYIFNHLNSKFCRSSEKDDDPKGELLVVVDNAETISDGAYAGFLGVEKMASYGQNFYKVLRSYCAEHRLRVWFSFEEEQAQHTVEGMHIATTDQAYAADVVIRLGIRVLKSGYKERALEIVKAKNQAYRRGRHHYSIVGGQGQKRAGLKGASGIVIYTSLATMLHKMARKDGHLSNVPVSLKDCDPEEVNLPATSLGLEAVDKVIRMHNRSADGDESDYLYQGDLSILVSDLDALSSDIGLQFILGSAREKHGSLYFTTIGRNAQIHRSVSRKDINKGDSHKVEKYIYIQELRPEHISEGKLLFDIQRHIQFVIKKNKNRPIKVVFDNIFDIPNRFSNIGDERRFITSLIELFKGEKVFPLIIDTVEAGEGRNPLELSYAAGLADNVFILRHVEIQSQVRKIFSVAKLSGLAEPRRWWELRHGESEVRAEGRLEFYKGLLSGEPTPVEISLSLYGDTLGSPLENYLNTQQRVLEQTFGQRVHIRPCFADSYASFQNSMSANNVAALGDCHIVSIDEIWLEELIRNGKLVDIENYFSKEDLGAEEYVTSAQLLAICKISQNKNHPIRPPEMRYAIPDRNNVGVLVHHSGLPDEEQFQGFLDYAKDRKPDAFKTLRSLLTVNNRRLVKWTDLIVLQAAFTRYVHPEDSYLITSNQLFKEWEPVRKAETDPVTGAVKFLPQSDPSGSAESFPGFGIFSFTMDQREAFVCFYLEILLSILPRNKHIVTKSGDLDFGVTLPAKIWKELSPFGSSSQRKGDKSAFVVALEVFLQLLSPWDIQRVAGGWTRRVRDERPCLFSRQWFSSWGILGLDHPGLTILPLPRGPSGTRGKPSPVSGSWYLGVLDGSVAVGAGMRLIHHLTSAEEELHKHNRGIGMPVRSNHYKKGQFHTRQPLPYAEEFAELVKTQKDYLEKAKIDIENIQKGDGEIADKVKMSKKVYDEGYDTLRKKTCPFSRSSINDYKGCSLLLMGFISRGATLALKYNEWLWLREESQSQWICLEKELVDLFRNIKNSGMASIRTKAK